jgi:hypothetical protein
VALGEVWLGTDTVLSRQVAIKLPHHEQAEDRAFRACFLAEAKHTAAPGRYSGTPDLLEVILSKASPSQDLGPGGTCRGVRHRTKSASDHSAVDQQQSLLQQSSVPVVSSQQSIWYTSSLVSVDASIGS